MTQGNLGGRSALVTGSTSGIGLGIARALASAGADLTLNGFGDAAEIEAAFLEHLKAIGRAACERWLAATSIKSASTRRSIWWKPICDAPKSGGA